MAAPFRDRLALIHERIDVRLPSALDHLAAALATLNREFSGDIAEVARLIGHAERHVRGELLGERSLPTAHLVALWMLRPAAVRRAFEPLLAEGDQTPTTASVADAGARLMKAVGDFQAALLVALADGRLTLAETSTLGQLLDEVEIATRENHATLIRRRP